MCIASKPKVPEVEVPQTPPPPEPTPVAPVIPAVQKQDDKVKANRRGTASLRINLNVAQPGGSGVQVPGG